jgi:hypothetical protein
MMRLKLGIWQISGRELLAHVAALDPVEHG